MQYDQMVVIQVGRDVVTTELLYLFYDRINHIPKSIVFIR